MVPLSQNGSACLDITDSANKSYIASAYVNDGYKLVHINNRSYIVENITIDIRMYDNQSVAEVRGWPLLSLE